MDPLLSDMGISLRLDADFCQGAGKIITALVDLIGDMEKRIKVQEELLQHYTAREQDDHGEESSAEEEEEEEEEKEEAESDGEFQTVENPVSLEADDDTNSTEDGDGEGDSEEEQGSEDSGSGEFQELESPDSDSGSADDIMFSEGEEMHGSWSSTAEGQLNRGPAEREVSKASRFKDTKGTAIPVLPCFDFQSGLLLEALSADRSDDSNSELDPPPNDGEEDDGALPESPTSDTSPGADIAFQCHSRRLDSILCVAEARTVPFRPKGRRMRTEAYACSEDFEYYV